MADRYPGATWNPVPAVCFTNKRTKKLANCQHRMVGYAGYMRTPHPEAVRRRISAHLTYDMDGRVEQHVDFDLVAHTQGIRRDQYAFARRNWEMFQERNPNPDCIGHEIEDGGKAFTARRPMPGAQLDALIDAHRWTLDNIIQAPAVLGRTEISHDILTTGRHQDPGDWVMNSLMDALAGAGSFRPSPASNLYVPAPSIVMPRPPRRRSKQRLRQLIVFGKRKCTFNDAVMLGWIKGDEARQWSRRVWYTLRKKGHSPLAPWRDGEHLYGALCGTMMEESRGDPKAHNHNKNGPLPNKRTGPSDDWGLMQFNSAWWPDISREQACDPTFAIDKACDLFPTRPKLWHGYAVHLRRKRAST